MPPGNVVGQDIEQLLNEASNAVEALWLNSGKRHCSIWCGARLSLLLR